MTQTATECVCRELADELEIERATTRVLYAALRTLAEQQQGDHA